MAKSVAPPSVTSVPPFCTKSLIAFTPSLPMPLRYSGGVVFGTLANAMPPRPSPRPPPGSPVIVAVESSAKMNTSYFALRLPFRISAS